MTTRQREHTRIVPTEPAPARSSLGSVTDFDNPGRLRPPQTQTILPLGVSSTYNQPL
jgi:hypothetical protein